MHYRNDVRLVASNEATSLVDFNVSMKLFMQIKLKKTHIIYFVTSAFHRLTWLGEDTIDIFKHFVNDSLRPERMNEKHKLLRKKWKKRKGK